MAQDQAHSPSSTTRPLTSSRLKLGLTPAYGSSLASPPHLFADGHPRQQVTAAASSHGQKQQPCCGPSTPNLALIASCEAALSCSPFCRVTSSSSLSCTSSLHRGRGGTVAAPSRTPSPPARHRTISIRTSPLVSLSGQLPAKSMSFLPRSPPLLLRRTLESMMMMLLLPPSRNTGAPSTQLKSDLP